MEADSKKGIAPVFVELCEAGVTSRAPIVANIGRPVDQ
jgi:hypothetical protein